MVDCLLDALFDTLKILPYLLVTFLILELIEHKVKGRNQTALQKHRKYGPIVGGLVGALPQCGFSAVASNLFSSRVITIGTVIAIFLSTSDEMLPVMLSQQTDLFVLFCIILAKVIIGIMVGLIVDRIYYRFNKKDTEMNVAEICNHDHCHCEEKSILVSSLFHTLKTGFFILIANIVISLVLFWIGEENLSQIILDGGILTYFIACLIGLIPNCASSVIVTELYLSGLISTGVMMSALLTGSGLGILLLFKNNKNRRENFFILGVIYFIGVIVGVMTDLFL